MVEKFKKMIFHVRLNEIFLKGKNQDFFISKLKMNCQRVFGNIRMARIPGGFEIESEKNICDYVKYVFGIANVSKVIKIQPDIDILKHHALQLIQTYQNAMSRDAIHCVPTFAIHTTRAFKQYPLASPDINKIIGGHIYKETGLRANIKNPDIPIFIDILSAHMASLYFEKVSGPGGLPVGSSAPVLSLISSGFDSPVASHLMMKRGAKVEFVHFHSYPFTSDHSIQNVKKIIFELSKYQGPSTLSTVPLGKVQSELVARVEEKYLVILYRRIMVRAAEIIANRHHIQALVTGDSLGQVASQTLENMAVISEVASLPILRPLISFDKQEIINMAEKIGTATISKQPYDDCCSRFVPKHPETKAKLRDILALEQQLPLDQYIQQIINGIQVYHISA